MGLYYPLREQPTNAQYFGGCLRWRRVNYCLAKRSSSSSSIMEGLQGMTPHQQQEFLQHLEGQQVCVRDCVKRTCGALFKSRSDVGDRVRKKN